MKTLTVAASLAALLLAPAAEAGRSRVSPRVKELRSKRIQCRVLSAQRFENGVLHSTLDPRRASFKTCNQDGGREEDDAMCFSVNTRKPDGGRSALGFGCIELNDETVQRFDAQGLRLYRAEYDEVVEIDFGSGLGRTSYEHAGSDWGRRSRIEGRAEFADCGILPEPAVDCSQAKD